MEDLKTFLKVSQNLLRAPKNQLIKNTAENHFLKHKWLSKDLKSPKVIKSSISSSNNELWMQNIALPIEVQKP